MRLVSRSPDETEGIGLKIGRTLAPGMLVKLYGDLGAGKTTMVRGIAAAFGIRPEDVISPSFTMITEYDSMPKLYHIDLYRLADGGDIEDIGIWDCIRRDSVTLIEWPEHADNELPADAVSIRIGHAGDDERHIEIEGIDEKDWHNL